MIFVSDCLIGLESSDQVIFDGIWYMVMMRIDQEGQFSCEFHMHDR